MKEHPSPRPLRERAGESSGVKVAGWLLATAGGALALAGVAVLLSDGVNRLIVAAISLWKGRPPNPIWLVKLRPMGVEALLGGSLLLVAPWLSRLSGTSAAAWLRKPRALAAAGTGCLLAVWLPVIFLGRSAFISEERYWWLFDDGMISMRYGRNLAHGAGLVWNPGEKIEGYSNFLWTLYMGLVHSFPLPASKTSLVVLLTNAVLAVATIPVAIRLTRLLGGGTLATLATVATLVFGRDVIAWGAGGLETVLLTLLLLLATCRVLEEARRDAPRLSTYFLVATLSLVRADGAVLSALLVLAALLLVRSRSKVVLYAAISLLLPAAHELFRIAYYGDLLSNTAYLKTASWNGRAIAGLRYVVLFVGQYLPLFPLAVLGARRDREGFRPAVMGLVLLYVAYVAYVGGDAFDNFRFLVPVLPFLAGLAFIGIESLGTAARARAGLAALCFLPMLIPGCVAAIRPNAVNPENIRIGLLAKQNTDPRCKIAEFYAGAVPYFSGRYSIDLLGKTDRYIAHLPAASDGMKPGHNKFDYDHSLGRLRPDLIVANFRLPDDLPSLEGESRGDLAFTGRLYFHPVFRAHCLPNPVRVDTWRTLFVCDWSPELTKKDAWRPLSPAR